MNHEFNLPLKVGRCAGYKPGNVQRKEQTCEDRLRCERYLQMGQDKLNGVEGSTKIHAMDFPHDGMTCLFFSDANKLRPKK